MAGDHVLGPRGLERALRRAMQRNCLFRERFGALSIDQVTVHIDPQRIDVLAGQLGTYASLPIPDGPGPLARLLADVATMVSHASLTVNIPSASAAELTHRTARIRADFALECAAVLAASRGYAVSVDQIPLSGLSRALWARDREQLAAIFQESLGAPRERIAGRPARVLSADSYWNLCSVTEEDGWPAKAVVQLIEDYLSPPPNSQIAAFYADEVSGDDWRRLYRWYMG
jgi:hypothetical protein